ncbi:MAG: carboxypeptidase regulatory-like domain-containing protein [Acidobacteriales bacterium]|nr:carboxypeptidase regulatory-like domain-containing protein [Terriglobales bacterium]
MYVTRSIAVSVFWALFLGLFPTSSLLSQTTDLATVRGQVFDRSRATVPGVQITATNQLTGLQRSTTSNTSGEFSLSGLPAGGEYEITATHSGFADASVTGVSLVGGSTASIELQLNPQGEKTEITVTGVAGEVRSDEPQIGDRLGTVHMQETPLLNRRITFLPLLNSANRPALTTGDVFINQNLFTTNGTGRRQEWFEVDGSNAVDTWGRQTIFSSIPLDAMQEMNVLTNAFSAEYGYNAGGAINIVTKTGTDQYHGSLLGLWRPSDTAATLSGFTPTTATSGNQLLSDELVQGAAAFGGPITDKTHFFLAGEYSWENKASPISSPIAPGSFVGRYRGWLGYARIDHQINDRNNLFLRTDADSFSDTNPGGTVGGNNLPTVDRVFKRRTYSAEIGETATLSNTWLNDARFQFQLGSPITQFDPVIFGTQYVVPISSGGTFTSGTSQAAFLQNRQYEFRDTVSAVSGRNTIRFGGNLIHSHNGGNGKEFGGPIYLGQLQYNTCTLTLAECESSTYLNDIANVKSYTQSFGISNYTVDDTLWAFFLQDDIRVKPNLIVNAGLRYELQTFTDSRHDFGPRVGFVYNFHGDGKTVVRSGYGIYYSQIVDNSQANYALTGPTGVFNYTAAPGQVGFPTSVADVPLPAFPSGAAVPLRSLYIRPGDASYYNQFFPTSTLAGYPDALLNPYTQQWTLGIERQLAANWVLSLDYVGSHTAKINRPLDVDAPSSFVRTQPGQVRTAQEANCTRPYWIDFYNNAGVPCITDPTLIPVGYPTPLYSVITSDVNNGSATYNSLQVNLNHRFSRYGTMLASYTWSHAIDTVDPDVPQQNPNDPLLTGAQEKGNAIFDQRHRFVLSGFYAAPFKINIGGVATLASGLPYNIVTGVNNSGDTGATTDRPVINGVVIPRNAGRGDAIYDVSPFVERPFALFTERVHLNIRAEAFNIFNHANFVGYSGTYGNGATPGLGFGAPLTGVTNQLPARSLQFSAKLAF